MKTETNPNQPIPSNRPKPPEGLTFYVEQEKDGKKIWVAYLPVEQPKPPASNPKKRIQV